MADSHFPEEYENVDFGELTSAVQYDDVETLSYILRTHGIGLLRFTEKTFCNPLWHAIDNRCKRTVRFLLEHGANPNISRKTVNHAEEIDEETPLQVAASRVVKRQYRVVCRSQEICMSLLEYGANPFTTDRKGGLVLTQIVKSKDTHLISLHLKKGIEWAKNDPKYETFLKYFQLLNAIEHRALWDFNKLTQNWSTNIDFQDISNMSPLLFAVLRGKARFVRPLIQMGADPNLRETGNVTILIEALLHKVAPHVIELLTKSGASIFCKCEHGSQWSVNQGKTALQLAILKRNVCAFSHMIHSTSGQKAIRENGESLLAYTTRNGTIDLIKIVLHAGVVLGKDSGKECVPPLLLAARWQTLEGFQIIWDFCADKNVVSDQGETILHMAAENPRSEVLEKVLSLRIFDINSRDYYGRTPLHHAGRGCKTKCKNIRLLLENGADWNLTTYFGRDKPYIFDCWEGEETCPAIRHAQKLSLLNYEIPEGCGRRVQDILNWTPDPKYLEELEEIKKVIIRKIPKITLFDILTARRRSFANYVKYPEFKKTIKEHNRNFAKKFPHYGFLIDWRLGPTLEWNQLTGDGIDKLSALTGRFLPWNVANQIIGYLRTSDLKNLHKAAKNL